MIAVAAWPMRNFEPARAVALWRATAQPLIEVAKDFVDTLSLKSLALELDRVRRETGARLSFAGTTDLVQCGGMPWDRYRQYLAVQSAQARFLGAEYFRLFAGPASAACSRETLLRRIEDVVLDLDPITPCIEIDQGVECDPETLLSLLDIPRLAIVLDIGNAADSGLEADWLHRSLPPGRVAYVHHRNAATWMEHEGSRLEEERWRAALPTTPFLWEPKGLQDPARIERLVLGL